MKQPTGKGAPMMTKSGSTKPWVVLALLSGVALAQAAEPLNVNYTYLEPSEGQFEDKVKQHEFKAEGSLPAMKLEDYGVGISVGGAFQANVWQFDNDRIDDLDLYKVKLPVTASFKATETIPVELSLVPGIHSDFKEVDGDDFRLEGSAVGSYAYTETLKFVFGLGYGEEFGDPKAFPIGGVSWKATQELQVDLIFPKPKISYAITDDARVFVSGAPAGGEWNVGERDQQVDVRQEGYRVGLGGEYQVVENGWLYAMAGREGGRKVSLAVDENTVVDEKDIDDATFVQVGFRLQ
jgi:hypothetical protein